MILNKFDWDSITGVTLIFIVDVAVHDIRMSSVILKGARHTVIDLHARLCGMFNDDPCIDISFICFNADSLPCMQLSEHTDSAFRNIINTVDAQHNHVGYSGAAENFAEFRDTLNSVTQETKLEIVQALLEATKSEDTVFKTSDSFLASPKFKQRIADAGGKDKFIDAIVEEVKTGQKDETTLSRITIVFSNTYKSKPRFIAEYIVDMIEDGQSIADIIEALYYFFNPKTSLS